MRILHLSMLYPPHVLGGAERSVALLAEAQARAGHAVSVACTTSGPFVEEERAGVRVFRMPHESLFWSEDVARHGALAYHWRKLAMPFNRGQRRHFERVLNIVRPDVFNSHSMIDVTTGCWLAAKAHGIPVVHTLRDYDLLCADGGLYHDGAPCGMRCAVVSRAKQLQARSIDAVAANSSETLRLHIDRGLFEQVPSALRRVIWNISCLPDADPHAVYMPPSGEFTLGYFGRITEEKGVGTLIEALQVLRRRGFAVRLRVGGKLGTGTERFVAQAEGLPVEWLGFTDAQGFFAGIDILVIPSIWPEPLPRTALEAYAAGVPVLGSRAGGTPDLIGLENSDWLFAPGDVDDLVARLVPIVSRGRGGLPDTANFARVLAETTESVVIERYLALYRDVLARGRASAVLGDNA